MAQCVMDLAGNPVALADGREVFHLSAILLELRMGQRQLADRQHTPIGGAKRDQEDNLTADIQLSGDEAERQAGTQPERDRQQRAKPLPSGC
ncbi:hypothetical protein KSX_39280 [Ktedonospora formicarum]|uniref:Uncharacterized protein n=1 Tax=Ktedonospora formicarum TaxID=2778364 RepID=A0A8J3I2S8_9CHLR|nr:hypothetical protein KSX_39280 [Ktedonospora formicarum]